MDIPEYNCCCYIYMINMPQGLVHRYIPSPRVYIHPSNHASFFTYNMTCILYDNSGRGVTAAKFRDYAIGSVGIIPGTVAYVFIGTTASSLLGDDSEDGESEEEEDDDSSSGSNVQIIVFVVGGIATVIAVVLISIYSKRALNKVLEEDMQAEERMTANNNGAEFTDGEMGAVVAAKGANEQGASRPSALAYPVRS